MAPRIDLVGLVTSDMAASLAFYRRLGLDIPAGAEDQPHVEAPLPGGLRIAWDTVETIRSFDPSWTPPSGGGRVELAFVCDDPADVDRQYAELERAGHTGHKAPWDAFWGQRYAIVLDPDGNAVALFAPLPESAPGDQSPGGQPSGGRSSDSSTES
ncbi:VOC family protein [Streptomyces sp. SS8]